MAIFVRAEFVRLYWVRVTLTGTGSVVEGL
jgi:hypothetical protein